MYFRNTHTKSGKVIQLVESFRDSEGRPRQRIIISLGDAPFPKALWKIVAGEIQNRLRGANTFIQVTDEEERWIEKVLKAIERPKLSTSKLSAIPNPAIATDPLRASLITQETQPILIQVDPTKISHQHTTELGPELVIMHAWKTLKIDSLLKSLGFGDRHVELALLSVANRLIDPRSEHALPAWVETTSFPDLCHHLPKNLIDDQFYRVADMLFKHKVQIEATLAETERSLFSLKRTLYLYDTSNTYFEGKLENNPKAKRSKNSKEKRTDAKLIAFGLVLDEDGFVIKHENFPGNMHDSPTLQKMINLLERDISSLEKPMIVMDSGFSGEENLKMLRDKGYDYIVTGRRPTRIAYEDDFSNAKFKVVTGRESKEPVSVAFKDEENERIVLCHSEARGEKEKAILSNAEKSFLKDLQNLAKRLQKKEGGGRLKNEGVANQAVGKLKERHSRVARYYDLSIEALPLKKETTEQALESQPEINNDTSKPEKKTKGKKIKTTKNTPIIKENEVDLKLHYKRVDEEYVKAERLCGSYYMRCTKKDLSDEAIWKLYMTLTRVEAGFRSLKTDLGLRPIFHHREDRCDSHIFITVLAYRILHWAEYVLRQKEDKRSWGTIRRVLQTHCYTTVICPASEGTVHHIRIPGNPERAHMEIYESLGVCWKNLPRNHIIIEKTKSFNSSVVSLE
jgi:transposase